mmetsp:Transcript_23301/g.72273  ORF Transcript_23301/g.72273 Transcript_23301/m.72273 type:complete len:203 (+) Transcript_23301:494-1102(+)
MEVHGHQACLECANGDLGVAIDRGLVACKDAGTRLQLHQEKLGLPGPWHDHGHAEERAGGWPGEAQACGAIGRDRGTDCLRPDLATTACLVLDASTATCLPAQHLAQIQRGHKIKELEEALRVVVRHGSAAGLIAWPMCVQPEEASRVMPEAAVTTDGVAGLNSLDPDLTTAVAIVAVLESHAAGREEAPGLTIEERGDPEV